MKSNGRIDIPTNVPDFVLIVNFLQNTLSIDIEFVFI